MASVSALANDRISFMPRLRAWVGSDSTGLRFDHVRHDSTNDESDWSHGHKRPSLKIRKPGCNPASGDRFSLSRHSIASSSNPVFLTRMESELTDKNWVGAESPPEFDRKSDLAEVSTRVKRLALPIEPGENIKAQMLRAFRRLRRALPEIKYSRFRDIWYQDERISVRGWEAKAIDRIASNAEAAKRAQHDAGEAVAAVRSLVAGAGDSHAGQFAVPVGRAEE